MRYVMMIQEWDSTNPDHGPSEKETWSRIRFNLPVQGFQRSEHDSIDILLKIPTVALRNPAFEYEFREAFEDMVEHANTQE